MRVHGLLSLTLPARDPEAAQRWWGDELGLSPTEEGKLVLDVGDVEIRFGAGAEVRLVASDLEQEPVRLVDPSGTVVEVVAPDVAGAERAEESIRDFRVRADELAGRPVDELADEVAALIRQARDRVAALMTGVPHNKVLATQLALGQRARELLQSEEQWPLHAASTLMSGLVIAGASGT